MKWQAFFFDFDGTLVDSIPAKGAVFREMFVPFGNKIQDNAEEYHLENPGMFRGQKFLNCYRDFFGLTISGIMLNYLCDQFSKLVIEKVIAVPEISGATDFLKRWSGESFCFIVSAMPDNELIKIVIDRGMFHFFKGMVGESHSKVQGIKGFCKNFGFNSTKCLMFGDSDEDFEAADSLGMEFIKISKNQTFEDIMKKGIL